MKKVLTLLLIAILAIGLFAGCKPGDKGSKGPNESDVSNNSQDESGDGRFVADVPYKDYGGRTIVILTAGGSDDRKSSEFSFEEDFLETPVNLSVEERNNKVEELLGIKIVEEYIVDPKRFVGGVLKERVELASVIQEDTFQLVLPSLFNCGALAAGGHLFDLNSLEHLHKLTAPWWDQNFVEDLTIDDKMFFITGDIGISTRNSITVCYFNKQMFKDNDLDDPYQLVRDKKWTFDKLIELSRTIRNDDNDDGVIDYQDTFGLGGQNDMAWAMFYGAGERIASTGSDGFPVLSMYNSRSVGVMDKMLDLLTNDEYFVNANRYFNISLTPVDLLTEAFLSDRSLLLCEGLLVVEDLREMAADKEFGILPIPLYNEDQDDYQHMINPWGGNALGIPAYITDAEEIEFASIVLEVLGAESKNYITPAYYDRALKMQATRDQESQEMLDIIFSNVGVDMGHIYNFGELGQKVLHASVSDKLIGQFQSTYQKYEDAAEHALEKTVDAFKELG